MATIIGGATGSTLTGTNAGDIALVSTTAAGVLENNDADYQVALSADGTKVAFYSLASNLAASSANGGNFNLFVKDLVTGTVTQMNPSGTAAQTGTPSFSPDGNGVAFSYGSDINPSTLVFKNLISGAVTTLASGGFEPTVSPDGSHVAYINTGALQSELISISGGAPTLISANASGVVSNGPSGALSPPAFSANGNLVLFESTGTNLGPTTDGSDHTFVKNLTTGAVTLVDASASGTLGDGGAFEAQFSPDGTEVVFMSNATNLVAGANNGHYQIYLKNLVTGVVTLVSSNAAGIQANVGGPNDSADPVFSTDGTKVYFDSDSTNLVAGDANGQSDVFVKTLATGAIAIVSTNVGGTQGNNSAFQPAVSADGNELAFKSDSTNLVSGDSNNAQDIFVKQITGNDSITGGAGNDVLNGLGGANTLTGGGGADLFVHDQGVGADTVTDFSHAQGDRVKLTGFGFHTLADVLAVSAQVGSNTVITLGSSSVTLDNVTKTALTAQDFLINTSTSDFSQTGYDGLLFRNAASGDWGFMQAAPGGGEVWHPIGATGASYAPIGRGDFNGDGVLDTAFRNGAGDWGFMSINPTGGETWHGVGNASPAYDAVATGDILQRGSADIAFRNAATGDWGFMSTNGSSEVWHPIGPTGTGYGVIGFGDFNGDGVFDVAFRNTSTGDWGFMSINPGGGETWHAVGSSSTAYVAVASADFLGTGYTEIAFRNNATGDFGFMQANLSGGETWHPIGPTGTGYVVIGNGDYNADGVQDVAFRNATTGDWGYMSVNPSGGETWHGVGNTSLAYGTI